MRAGTGNGSLGRAGRTGPRRLPHRRQDGQDRRRARPPETAERAEEPKLGRFDGTPFVGKSEVERRGQWSGREVGRVSEGEGQPAKTAGGVQNYKASLQVLLME